MCLNHTELGKGLYTVPEMRGRRKCLENEAWSHASTDGLDGGWLAGVTAPVPNHGVEQSDHVDDVVAPVLGGGAAEVVEINQFDVEEDTSGTHEDIPRMNVPVIFPQSVNLL